MHFALQGVWEFQSKNNRLPVPRYEDDAKECIRYAKEYNEACQKDESAMAVEEVDEKIVKLVAMFADTEFQPHACFFGGCLAQEAVKLAGKYNPLNQWCHLDCFEVLPEELLMQASTRYDATNIVCSNGKKNYEPKDLHGWLWCFRL